jgi:hypothetical protein
MTGRCRFAYAQARLQARFASLPSEADWQRLSAARTLSGYLEESRDGALKAWVKGFSAQSDSHDIERGIRGQFADCAERTAAHVPEPWRDAVLWCRWLPLLGLFDHLQRGAPVPRWAARDRRIAALLGDDGDPLHDALERRGLTPLLDGDAGDAWQREWRRRWPRCSRAFLDAVEAVGEACAAHLRQFGRSSGDDAWALRRALRADLRLQFHLHPLQPAAAFIFLTLVGLDLERLRRALLDRALFGLGEAA